MNAAPARETFPKALRLLKRSEFRRVYERGERRSAPLGVVFYCSNGLSRTRLGITAPGRLGGAVLRNRVKRRVREVFRRNRTKIPAGWDIVVNPRPPMATVPYERLERELLRLLPTAAPPQRFEDQTSL
jgi:ribonuclease P protein component